MSLTARIASLHITAAQVDNSNRSWIELIPTADKARNGPWYFTITRDDLDAFAASVEKNAGKIPVDYDHEGDVGGSTRAAGWFTGETQIVLSGETAPSGQAADHDAAWAEVEWTPRAVQEIRDGEFRFMSPVFTFEEKDPKTGLMTKAKQIVASTLTNRGFFTQMAPVTAAVVWAPEEGYMQLSERVYDALNPGGPEYARFWVMDIAPGKALVKEYDEQRTWVVPFTVADTGEIELSAQSDWTPAEQEWVAAVEASLAANRAARPFTLKENPMDLKILAKQLGLPEDADEDAFTAAVKAQNDKTAELEQKIEELEAQASGASELETKVSALATELATEKEMRVKAEVAKAVEDGVREFRLTPAMGEVLTEQFGDNVDGLKAVIAASAPGSIKGGKPVGVGDDRITDDPDLEAAAKDFKNADDIPVDDDDLRIHAKAVEILTAAGKTDYSADEYVAACDQAQRDIAAA